MRFLRKLILDRVVDVYFTSHILGFLLFLEYRKDCGDDCRDCDRDRKGKGGCIPEAAFFIGGVGGDLFGYCFGSFLGYYLGYYLGYSLARFGGVTVGKLAIEELFEQALGLDSLIPDAVAAGSVFGIFDLVAACTLDSVNGVETPTTTGLDLNALLG